MNHNVQQYMKELTSLENISNMQITCRNKRNTSLCRTETITFMAWPCSLVVHTFLIRISFTILITSLLHPSLSLPWSVLMLIPSAKVSLWNNSKCTFLYILSLNLCWTESPWTCGCNNNHFWVDNWWLIWIVETREIGKYVYAWCHFPP